jgi:hypothetical protein
MKLTTGKVKREDRNFPLAESQGGWLSTMNAAGLMFGNGVAVLSATALAGVRAGIPPGRSAKARI